MRTACLLVAALVAGLGSASSAAAQARINVRSFALGVDVPEPPALVALGVGPPVRLGSAPKPTAFAFELAMVRESMVVAAAVDFTPYYLFGGGVRSLDSYRSMSVAGRLMRVLTKTIVSVGAAHAGDDPDAFDLAVALRSTFHDPHDPIGTTRLPEEIAAAFGAAGVELPAAVHERLAYDGVDLAPLYARARQQARARGGDAQVSGGYGVSARAAGGSGGGLGSARHTGWLAAQYTFGARYDLIGTAEVRDAFGDGSRFIGGLALRRKGDADDIQLGLRYDARNDRIHAAALLDARLADRIGAIVWIDSEADEARGGAERRLRAGVLARWFAAADRSPR